MNDTEAHRAYMDRRFTQLKDALEIGDGDAAVSVFAEMVADGYAAEADRIMDGLIEIGLRRLADQFAAGTADTLALLAPQRPDTETSALSALGTQLKAAASGKTADPGDYAFVVWTGPTDRSKWFVLRGKPKAAAELVVTEVGFGDAVRLSVRDAKNGASS